MTEILSREMLEQLDDCITFETDGDVITFIGFVGKGKTWYFSAGGSENTGYGSRQWLNGTTHVTLPTTDSEIKYALGILSKICRATTTQARTINYILAKYGS